MRLALHHALTAAVVVASAFLPIRSSAPVTGMSGAPLFAAEPPADLHGTWVLNKELGSDPIGELETRRARRPVGAGGMGGPGAGGGLGGPLIGGQRRIDRADADEMARVKEMLRQTMAASERITITVDGPLIEVVGLDGTVHRLHADGKKVTDRSYSGLEFERKTKWDGPVLVTEFTLKDSETKAKQTWTRTGTRLSVVTKLTPPHGAEPLEVRRTYDLAGAATEK
jgi:hypothetical protein